MPHPPSLVRRAVSATLIAIPLCAVLFTAALAHSGHAHSQGGFEWRGILEVAGTAAALVILYVLATWFFRARDNGKPSLPGGGPQPGQRSHMPDAPGPAPPVHPTPAGDTP